MLKKGVLLERRRREDAVLVAHDLLDVAHEALAHAGRRGAVVVHHRAVLLPIDVERVDHQPRRDLGWGIDEAVVVLESVVALVGGTRIAGHDVPARRRRDAQHDRIRLVPFDVHEERCAVPVRMRRIEDAERA